MRYLIIFLLFIFNCEYIWYDYSQITVGKMYDYYFENDIPIMYSVKEIQYYVADNIKYEYDLNKDGEETDYWQLPEQTDLFSTGDCEDFVLLFAYLCKEQLGISVIFVSVIDSKDRYHMMSRIDDIYYENITRTHYHKDITDSMKNFHKEEGKITWECTYEEAIWMTYYYHDNVGKYF